MNSLLQMKQYPLSLNGTRFSDMPIWFLGDPTLLKLPLVSVIGTRDVSAEGILRTKRVTRLLVQAGYCIVSGLAKGVDTAAHKAALENGGKTIAVMGTAIDECYPKENAGLKAEIIQNGLVLSQFELNVRTNRGNFPQRNALMAALSEMTLVIEASEKSGTRHQVNSAIKMGRKVGFLASLSIHGYPWILEALDSGLGFIIQKPEDVVRHLDRSNGSISEQLPIKNSILQDDLFLQTPNSNDLEQELIVPKKKKTKAHFETTIRPQQTEDFGVGLLSSLTESDQVKRASQF